MEDNWRCVFRSGLEYEIEMIRGLLEIEGIASVIINKKDASYLIGDLELYVQQEDVFEANRVINDQRR